MESDLNWKCSIGECGKREVSRGDTGANALCGLRRQTILGIEVYLWLWVDLRQQRESTW